MSEVPRGWTFARAPGGGAALSVTVPAIVGVAHVLDGLTVKAINNSAGVEYGPVTLLVSSSGGTLTNVPLAVLHLEGAGDSDGDSASDLGLMTEPNESLTVSMTGGNANTSLFLLIQGHDI